MERIINRHYETFKSNDTFYIYLNQLNEQAKKLEQESIENKQKAKKLIEDITHQIKTPLAALKINIDLIDDQVQKESCIKNMNRIETITNTLIQMSKLENHQIRFNYQMNSLLDCFEEIEDDLQLMIQEKGITVHKEIEDLYFHFDYLWMKEALLNIVKNAIEYSPKQGNLYLYAKEVDKIIIIRIQDEGIGFEGSEKEHVFDRFYSSKANSRKQKGMGIGLNISYEVIKGHLGQIYALHNQSLTTFTIQLPIIQGKDKV